MSLLANCKNVAATNFDILNFYGKDMCFAWSGDTFVVFPYVPSVPPTKLSVHVVPQNIRILRGFGGRVLILCKPTGVYKLSRTYETALLSSNAIANGPTFYEVLIPTNNWLSSHNKFTKTIRQLFPLEHSSNESFKLCDITLTEKNSELCLRQAIHPVNGEDDEDICVLAYDKKVFKISQSFVQLIHRTEQDIVDIVGVLRNESITGLVLVMRNAAVLVHVVQEKLIFDKVYLDSDIRGLCAGISATSEDTTWLAYVDGERIHYWTKSTKDNTFRKISSSNNRFVAIKNYKCKLLICLSDTSQLVELQIDLLGLCESKNDEFIGLKSDMLRGSDAIVDAIYNRAKELQSWIDRLLDEQKKLRRINIYSHKQKIVYLPEIRVERFAGKLFVRINFDGVLPSKCHVVGVLKTERRITYCIKLIDESETTMDLQLENESLDNSTRMRIDLITLAEESRVWCLVRDFVNKPKILATSSTPTDREKFLNAKLTVLRNLNREGNIDIRKLAEIKRSIRKEFKNL